MHEVVQMAAQQWAAANASAHLDSPVEFGKRVALVAMSANTVVNGATNVLRLTAALAELLALCETTQLPAPQSLHSRPIAKLAGQVQPLDSQ